jgi:flagellar basal-body rod modification protein FlgD
VTYSSDNSEISSTDFLTLMIEELSNQDPLDPVSNQDLLNQVAQIKNMETLSNLDDTLGYMTYQQQLATASTLIGRKVSGVSSDGANVSGVVVKLTGSETEGVTLTTEEGDIIPVSTITEIESAEEASQDG